jgi:hypothetical protein
MVAATEEQQHRGDEDRSERESDVAPEREVAHPGGTPGARDVVGEARALRVEGGNPEPAEQDRAE